MADAELAQGTAVHGYRIERVLGRGGMGTVYGAVHLETQEPCAVKVMHARLASSSDFRKRFFREARAAMAAVHPNIVHVREVFEHDGVPMQSMELLSGESLELVLHRENKLALGRVARILVRVTSGLGTAHAMGIIHRDLKPDNIFIHSGLTSDFDVKVLDFGIAKLTATQGVAAETAALTETGALMGTPFYMSPEQAFGEKRIDHRADIWALGIILYRCLSGVLPTWGKSFGEVFRLVVEADYPPIESLVPDLPPDVAALVRRMLSKLANDRPWDLREVHAVLQTHANESAPEFGRAIEPKWDESSTKDSAIVSVTANTVAAPSPALTPRSLHMAAQPMKQQPLRTQAMRVPAGKTPTGTLALDPRERAATPSADGETSAMPSSTIVMSPEERGSVAPTLVPAPRAPTSKMLIALLILLALAFAGIVFALVRA